MTLVIVCGECRGEIGPHWQVFDHVHPEAVDHVGAIVSNNDLTERFVSELPAHPKVRRGQRTVHRFVEQLRAVVGQRHRYHGTHAAGL